MISKFRKLTELKDPRPLLLLLSAMFGTSILSMRTVTGQPPMAIATTPSPAITRNDFQLVSGPIRKVGISGTLEKSGCYARGNTLVRETYALGDGSTTSATAEVLTFPKDYPFAAHDAFGALLTTAAYDEKSTGRGDLSLSADRVRCMQWEFANGSKGTNICYVHKQTTESGPSGTVRWLAGSAETGTVSVGISYRNLTGLPGQVIDKYLREYPSTLPIDPTWHLNWDTKDLEKWADVLDKNKGDLELLQAGAAYLTRYDKRSFGLLDALRHRDNTAISPQALDDVISRLSQAAAERKVTSAQPDNPND